jgi:hypothetical protein
LDVILEPLGKQHDRSKFSCGQAELDDWFRRRASQDERRNIARVFVAVNAELGVVGFYSLSSFKLDFDDLPEEVARKLPRYDGVPAALIGRLARDSRVRGRGVGETVPVGVIGGNGVGEDVDMASVPYFAYGSNMLTERLQGRCKSAEARCVGLADGYRLAFSKKSLDGSGKATIRPDEASRVYGVVFDIDETEIPALDVAEVGYGRDNAFRVHMIGTHEHFTTFRQPSFGNSTACAAAIGSNR